MPGENSGNGIRKGGNLVFVYGTLMKGQRAHEYLQGAEYVGAYRLTGYAMYDLGWYPGIVPEAGRTVYGEVYRVSDRILHAMDGYEGEGSLYDRKTVTVRNENGTLETYAYVYARKVLGTLIPEGKWNR